MRLMWSRACKQSIHNKMWRTHTQVKMHNLLDHINFFPSKEEGRIPGERKALNERKAKRVNTVSKESYLCHSCEGKVC